MGAITVGIFGSSGDGKSTSIAINPDGTYNQEDYKGMNPETTIIINSDRKKLPFYSKGWIEDKNIFSVSNTERIMGDGLEGKKDGLLQNISKKAPNIKAIIIDTVNGMK